LISRSGGASGHTLEVQAEAVGSGTGEYFAFARYRAPKTFPRSTEAEDLSVAERQLRLTVNFEPSDGSAAAPAINRDLRLARPPVVLIHGLASSSETWATFQNKLQQRIPGIYADAEVGDYRVSNFAHLSVNGPVPTRAANRARDAYRERGLAAVQVDVFGHSMGGILSRIAAGSDGYRRDSDFGEGFFNKVVTLDSPHHGAPLADLVWDAMNWPFVGRAIERMLGAPPAQSLGAVQDLQTDSVALCAMGAQGTDVPAHAIGGATSSPCPSTIWRT
jgi:pimeloyl-ACP methyl ester carboxylesterase